MLKFKKLIGTSILLLACIATMAQQNTTSPYSRYGLGELDKNNTGQSVAMGGLSLGMRTMNQINSQNPASYSSLYPNTFLFEVGIKSRVSNYSLSGKNFQGTFSNLDYISAATHVTRWWAIAGGLKPYTSTGYKYAVRDSILQDNVYQQLASSYQGSGGLNKAFLGNSFKFFNKLSIGFNASFIFGNIQRNSSVMLSTANSDTQVKDENSAMVNNFAISYGAQYSDTIFKNKILTLGFTFENKTNLNLQRTRIVTQASAFGNGGSFLDTISSLNLNSEKITVPIRFGAGFSFASERWIIGADYITQKWEPVTFLDEVQPLTTSTAYSAGVEFCKNKNSFKVLKSIRLRAGAYYSDYYVKVKDKTVNDMGVTFGIGIPLRYSGTMINIGVQMGQRGSSDYGVLKEKYTVFSLNVNLYDIWYIKRKFD